MSTKRSFDLETILPQLADDWRLAAVVAIMAVIQQAVGHLNGDNSWFLTFAEKYRDGLVPYVDVSDPNPPAAFLVYLPAVLIARGLSIAPELVLATITFVGTAAAIFLSGAILRRAGLLQPCETWRALAIAIYALLFVTAFCFAEREHIALLAMLPMVAAGAARAAGGRISLRDALLAGLGCGIACAFKPYFLLPVACVVLYAAIARRSVAPLMAPETAAAAVSGVIYLAAIFVFFPAYFSDALPLLVDVYAPLRDTLPHILNSPLFIANFALLAALMSVARGKNQHRTRALAAASAGFLVTYLIQSKGWMNHAYPGMALALLASASFLSGRGEAEGDETGRDPRSRRRFALFIFIPVLCLAPFLFGTLKDFGSGEEYPGLTDAVRRVAPAHPKISALAEQLDVGHPLVRRLGGTWVGRQNCLWISWGVRYLLSQELAKPADRERLTAYMRQDEETFAEDVISGKPDVLLVESPTVESWARTQPALDGIFQGYRRVARAGNIGIWLRNDDESADRAQRAKG